MNNYFKFKLPFSFIVFGYFLGSLIIGYLNEEKIDKKDILINLVIFPICIGLVDNYIVMLINKFI